MMKLTKKSWICLEGETFMTDFEVEPTSRCKLQRLTAYVREILHLENVVYFPIVEMLDILTIIDTEFSYEIVKDSILPSDIHADTDVQTRHIRIKESVYNGACEGNGRDRMTIAHEIGHYITLCVCGFKFHRRFSNEKLPAYRDPEWQAKCFAGELLMNLDHIKNMSVEEIMINCGVSEAAAIYHYNLLHRVHFKKCA